MNKTLLHKISCVFICAFSLFACKETQIVTQEPQTAPRPAHVEVKQIEGQYSFYVDGKPFKIYGVGMDTNSPQGMNFKTLKDVGGNAFRTWRTLKAEQELDSASKYGLMVAMGLDIGKELHHFDYDDEIAVAKQLAHFKGIINKYKDHPNLLCWVAGNELNLLFDENGGLKLVNPKVYSAVCDLIDYIHEVDPHHPVTFTFATGVRSSHIDPALERCPQIDFMSYQVYGDLPKIPSQIQETGIKRPFVVTEFGPMGHWERPATEWGREIEEPSSIKAKGFADRIRIGFQDDDTGLNMGGFAFMWGQKQERTPTWYGMFHKDGSLTETIDELTLYWTGKYPENRAPQTTGMTINHKEAVDNIYLKPNSTATATLKYNEPDNDPLTFTWVIMKEVDDRSKGGEFEKQPDEIPFKIITDKDGVLTFETPTLEGDYRLFAYIYDGKGKVGYSNIPFYIKK